MSNHSYLTQSYLIDEFAYVCVCNDGCSIVLNSFVMFGGGILWNTLIVQEISAKKKKKIQLQTFGFPGIGRMRKWIKHHMYKLTLSV